MDIAVPSIIEVVSTTMISFIISPIRENSTPLFQIYLALLHLHHDNLPGTIGAEIASNEVQEDSLSTVYPFNV